MDRTHFKKIKNSHFDICEQIINEQSCCETINCNECPFDISNTYDNNECCVNYSKTQKSLIANCKQFLTYKKDLGYEYDLLGVITIDNLCQFVIELDLPVNVGTIIKQIETCLIDIDKEYTFHIGTLLQLTSVFFEHDEDIEYKYKIRKLLNNFKFAL